MKVYFNSHDKFYKNPFGAVKTDDLAEFKISIADTTAPAEVFLRIWQNNAEVLHKMTLISEINGEFTYGATVQMPPAPMLVWYYFVIHTADNRTFYYGNNAEYLGGVGELSTEPPQHSYQITVYDKDFTVPQWFRDGIMYQIFVDRFAKSCRGGILPPVEKNILPKVRYRNWNEPMQFHQHPFENGYAANDFYGGNLEGVIEKLPYLKELNVSIIYLNPIFEAYSNHKYDTADYKNIDSYFGDNETFTHLCKEAEKFGIKVILDGVFSHTGADSLYFNKYGTYGENVGAYRDKTSPYREWYEFGDGNSYQSWWGCTTLPNVKELTPSYLDYILRSDDSVVKLWLDRGASGWRLDVADELPPEFLKILRREVKSKDPNAIIIGEVWEDASNKISYGAQREYLLGGELDTVMNYPFKDNVIAFVLGHICANTLHRRMMRIFENYPRDCAFALMNLVGGHDVVRLKSTLGEMYDDPNVPKYDKQFWKLSPEAEALATKRQKLITLLQMTFVGVPCIYYGDEIGMQGLSDPLNRATMKWSDGDSELLKYYRCLTKIRRERDVLRRGEYKTVYAQDGVFAFVRFNESEKILCIVNRDNEDREVRLDPDCEKLVSLIDGAVESSKILKIKSLEGNIYELYD
ncbi:MAG: glycoside hydrolase family 13 protein [Oscillospiraceae bacterium]|nr:glycoside hydrolase family 13 protein [Oscillospiraceae bacterium]